MRIGIYANSLLSREHGGVEVYTDELVSRLPRFGREHDFCLYFNCFRRRHQAATDRFTRPGVHTHVCGIPGRLLEPLHLYLHVPVDWLAGKVDVMFYPSFVAPPQRSGRAVVTVHDLIPLSDPQFCEPHHIRYCKRRVPASLRRANAIIAVSAHTKELVEERFGLPAERIHCIPNGVHQRFRPPYDVQVADPTLSRYGIRGPYLLFVGTIEPRKNLVRLVQAFGRAAWGAVREHTLVIVGKPAWDTARVTAAIDGLGRGVRVLRPGHVDAEDLPALYGAATALLFPSLAEGFGIPALEAMACGCPVLTSAIPPLSELVADAALTVDPWDTDAIADGIRRLVENSELRQALRARGLRRAEDFSWDKTAAQTLAVLEAA